MKTRKLGRTGLHVSQLGYGAWGIGGDLWADSDDAASLASLRRALDVGVNFFDTAYVYGDGHSEELIGRAFKEAGRRGMVATKLPTKERGLSTLRELFPADWIIHCTERSLKKLQREQIEVQQLHAWDDSWLDTPGQDELLGAFERLKRDGKIRYWGVSITTRRPKTALKIAKRGLPDTMQLVFNLFEQEPIEELLPACKESGIGVIARVPFDEGGLTGKLKEDTVFPEGDYRQKYFAGPLLAETVKRAKALEDRLVRGDTPDLAAAALRYCLSVPEVSTVIPGMRTPKHVDSNVAAANLPPYSPEELKDLRPYAWKR